MHLQSFSVRNYRRLRDVRIELESGTSIFVGSNNSGKTSAAKIFDSFLGTSRNSRFSFYDFSASCWPLFDAFENKTTVDDACLPTIVLDLWFKVTEADLHRVLKILPSLDWKDTPVGVRLEYAPKNAEELLSRFQEARAKAAAHASNQTEKSAYCPWPTSLSDYLKKRLGEEYKIHHYVLDYEQCDEHFKPKAGYVPQELGDTSESGAKILRSIVRVDFLDAQRFQSDEEITHAEGLSKRLSRFYERNLEKYNEDFTALAALASSEQKLNEYFASVFGPTLEQLNKLGYPGFANPDLVIRSAFDPESILTKNASVHYALQDPGEVTASAKLILPDKYNGLGFKNLIFMVVELLDFHHQWAEEEEKRPLVHLVLVEEPEAHLHIQLQQVFINKIQSILPAEPPEFSTQMILTTHSPHIIYESSFKPIRYFRRMAKEHYSEVLSLSNFYEREPQTSDFLHRYMKLTHCDLFFADAAILVEGNVERLLLPHMIEEVAPRLKSSYLSILEVGGAFAHKFKELVHFLGLTTLIITDLDSVFPKRNTNKVAGPPTVADANAQEVDGQRTGCCMTHEEGAVTSNETLKQWIPQFVTIAELLAARDEHKCPPPTQESPAKVRVAYQTRRAVRWGNEKTEHAGRTFEEAFALQNLEWLQEAQQKGLRLGMVSVGTMTLDDVISRIHKKVKSDGFKKTDFALALMQQPKWCVPLYIAEGLSWLSAQMVPSDGKPVANTKGNA